MTAGDLPEARYDEFADWYAERAASGHWVDATILANIEPLIGVVDGLDVLELCCGEGSFAARLASLGARVIGVDLSAKLLEIASARARTDRFASSTTMRRHSNRLTTISSMAQPA